jgi:hypothetical protein
VTGRDEDETWRSIVENYGERPTLPEPPTEAPKPVEEPAAAYEPEAYDEEGYVPPDPPPVPVPERSRLAAWAGVLGAPVVLVVLMLAGVQVGSWVLLMLVAAFTGGFGYLVATMSREPRDPWDDGSRI